jgi:hypothetical protein
MSTTGKILTLAAVGMTTTGYLAFSSPAFSESSAYAGSVEGIYINDRAKKTRIAY